MIWAYLQPFLLFLGQHVIFDHFGLDRHTGEAFEPQPDVAVEFAFGLDSPHSEGRLNSHTPLALEIYTKSTQLTVHAINRLFTYRNQAH